MALSEAKCLNGCFFHALLSEINHFFADLRLYGIPAGNLTFCRFEYMLVLNKDMLI